MEYFDKVNDHVLEGSISGENLPDNPSSDDESEEWNDEEI
jgi:hypothetical protein